MNSISAKPFDMKNHNRRRLLNLLRKNGQMSISALSDEIGLSRTSVIKILKHFEDLGYVKRIGKGESTLEGGKKPELFAFDGRFGYVCAISIRERHIIGGMTDLSGRLLLNMRMLHSADQDIHRIISNIETMITTAVDSAGLPRGKLFGVVLGCDGLIDSEHGVVQRALHFPSWGDDMQIADLLRVVLGRNILVSVENAVGQLALSEVHHDATLIGKRVLTIYHGDSVYAGMLEPIANDHPIVRTLHIGLMKLENGKEYGTLSSKSSIISRAKKEGLEVDSLSGLLKLSQSGNSMAQKIIQGVLELNCSALYNVMLLFDPDIIVMQGDYAALGEGFRAQLQKLLREQEPFSIGEPIELKTSTLDINRGFLLGAAMSMIDRIFDDEIIYQA